jgi:hypothetical protein
MLSACWMIGCSSPPSPLPDSAPTVDVCAAARQAVGSRIRVRGEFNGFGYDTESRLVVLSSDDICSARGAGSIFATLYDRSERSKIRNARPPGRRSRSGIPGTMLTIEGTVTRVEDGRFVHIDHVVVR